MWQVLRRLRRCQQGLANPVPGTTAGRGVDGRFADEGVILTGSSPKGARNRSIPGHSRLWTSPTSPTRSTSRNPTPSSSTAVKHGGSGYAWTTASGGWDVFVGDGLFKYRPRNGEEHRIQQQQQSQQPQPAPGVQPGHGLAQPTLGLGCGLRLGHIHAIRGPESGTASWNKGGMGDETGDVGLGHTSVGDVTCALTFYDQPTQKKGHKSTKIDKKAEEYPGDMLVRRNNCHGGLRLNI